MALKAKAEPLWAKEEKARKAGLSPAEKMKEQGDALYKEAKFEEVRRRFVLCCVQVEWRVIWLSQTKPPTN